MVELEQVFKFIKDHPGCSRQVIYDHFAGKKTGKERCRIVKSIIHRIDYLIRNRRVTETDIERRTNDGKGNISKSKLFVNESRSTRSESGPRTEEIPAERTLDLGEKSRSLLVFLLKTGTPMTVKEIGKRTGMGPTTLFRILVALREQGLVSKGANYEWVLTPVGISEAKKTMPFKELYAASPTDNFFYHIPMLVGTGEKFTIDNIAQRAYGYQGFYEKLHIDEREAKNDFREKIRLHLENEALKSSFIQEDLFEYKATADEDQIFLWRLYALLHTVLFKSSTNKKLGMSVWLYEPLLTLLKGKWNEVMQKVSALEDEDHRVVMLMLNGVQLETILPSIKIANFREKMKLCGIPLVVYNEGTDNEVTLIEESTRKASRNER